MNLWKRLRALWPFVLRRTFDNIVKRQGIAFDHSLESTKKYWSDKLTRKIKAEKAILKRLGTVNWRYDDLKRCFELRLYFNPEAFGYGYHPEEMKCIAEMFGREVEATIATSRFIHDARETKRKEASRMRFDPSLYAERNPSNV